MKLNLPLIPQDKANHFAYGVVIFLVGLALALLFVDHFVAVRIGLALSLIGGVAKEILDHFTGGDVDPLDSLVTTMGGLACFLASLGA